MKNLSLTSLTVLTAISVASNGSIFSTAHAADGLDNPRTSPHLEVRERANYRDPLAAYWEGFKLKNAGDCESAVERLKPIAMNGRGYESAQHALGLCLMSLGGLPSEQGAAFDRGTVSSNQSFKDGKTWVIRAANAGQFQAQRTLLALYAVNLGPDESHVEIGKWLQLYDVNPLRLTLGAAEQGDGLRQFFTQTISHSDLLRGKDLARSWTPTFWAPPGVNGDN